MFCVKCGTENSDTSKFCKTCGNSLDVVDTDTENSKLNLKEEKVIPTNNLPTKRNSLLAKIFILVCLMLVIIFAFSRLNKVSNLAIDINKYLIIDIEGYNSYGIAKATIDWKAIEEKYADKLSYKESKNKEYKPSDKTLSPFDLLKSGVLVSLDKNSSLSNGDKVGYTWDINKDIEKYLNCRIKFKDGNIKIKELASVDTFDAFEGLEIEFLGIAPNGRVNFNYFNSDMVIDDFKCDKPTGLSNGDIIKVSIDSKFVDKYIEKFGKVPEKLEKEYKVSGLKSYVRRLADIDRESLDIMKAQGEDAYRAIVANAGYGDESKIESLNYIGNYLLTIKETKNSDDKGKENTNNVLRLVYKADFHNSFTRGSLKNRFDDRHSVYWFMTYSDLILNSEGKLELDPNNYIVTGNTFEVGYKFENGTTAKEVEYNGYKNLDALYSSSVVAYIDKYNHEDNVDENKVEVSLKTTQEQESSISSEETYILFDSDKRLITREELDKLSEREVRFAENEIYARHGRRFKDAQVQAYFDSCSWYQGSIEADDFAENILSDIEKQNRDLIVAYGNEKGYR